MRIKQRKFIDEFLKSRNATEAAMEVYDCKNRETAAAIGYENLRKPKIREEIERLLQSEGVDLSQVLKSLKENLKGAGKNPKPSDANRAAELLLKVGGYLDKDRIVEQRNYLNIDLRTTTASELMKKRNEYRAFFESILDGEELSE